MSRPNPFLKSPRLRWRGGAPLVSQPVRCDSAATFNRIVPENKNQPSNPQTGFFLKPLFRGLVHPSRLRSLASPRLTPSMGHYFSVSIHAEINRVCQQSILCQWQVENP